MKSLLELTEVGALKVKMELPSLRVGDKLSLGFKLKRQNGGRTEVLDVQGDYRVSASLYDSKGSQQILAVEALGVAPVWKAVRKQVEPKRKLGPTHYRYRLTS